jgi:PPK2 family polyphosphate:nucleotide phosphotransferase
MAHNGHGNEHKVHSKDRMARLRVDAPRSSFSLAAIDPGEQPCSSGSKTMDREQVEALAIELDALQNLFYADRRYKLLVVLQGLDTSGKDGTLRTVFGRMSPLGVRTVAWKAPTEAERARDFLWRIHQEVPACGEVVVFNRSHYEDVLVPVVNGALGAAQTRLRYAHINDFERMLAESGTVVLKFMLHISKDEQRLRLQERLDQPDKRYKFQRGDLEVRKQWDSYQEAYGQMIAATGTAWAPWIVVPADSKTHRNLMIGQVLRDELSSLGLRFPDDDPSLASLKVE